MSTAIAARHNLSIFKTFYHLKIRLMKAYTYFPDYPLSGIPILQTMKLRVLLSMFCFINFLLIMFSINA